MLLCEHDPVYTFGLREKDYALRAEELQKLGAEVFKVCVCVYVCMYIHSTHTSVPSICVHVCVTYAS